MYIRSRLPYKAHQGFHAFPLARVPLKDVLGRIGRLTDGIGNKRLHSHLRVKSRLVWAPVSRRVFAFRTEEQRNT